MRAQPVFQRRINARLPASPRGFEGGHHIGRQADGGGPRGLIPIVLSNSGGNTWSAGLKRRRSAAVSSRTSPFVSISGARLAIVFDLSRVGLAKADDANAIGDRKSVV